MSGARKLLLLAIVVGLFTLAMRHASLRLWLLELVEWVRGRGLVGALVFTLVYVLGTVALVPGAFLTISAGFLYGPWRAALLVLVASVVGAVLAFLLARSWLRPWVVEILDKRPRLRRMDERLEREGWKIVALLRLSPLVPFSVLNYALGLTRVRFRDYFSASCVAMIPGIFLYTYIGSLFSVLGELQGSRGSSEQRLAFWLGMVATVLVTIFLVRWSRRALAEEP